MGARARAVTRETLGGWLFKTTPSPAVADLVSSGFRTVTRRCVTPSYRVDLLEPGQPVLLWISGDAPGSPSGIYGQGRITGRVEAVNVDGRPELSVPLELEPVQPPVLRSEILAHPVLGQIEVVRMPAGSNPSFLTRQQLAALREQWRQVAVG